MAEKNDETPDAGWTADGAAGVNGSQSSDAARGYDAAREEAAQDQAAQDQAAQDQAARKQSARDNVAPAAAASTPAAPAPPAASVEKPGRIRRLLVPGIALVAGLAIGLGGGALLGSTLDGPRGFDRAGFVSDDGNRPGGPALGDGPVAGGPRGDGPDAGHRHGPHGDRDGDADDTTDDTDDTTDTEDTDDTEGDTQ